MLVLDPFDSWSTIGSEDFLEHGSWMSFFPFVSTVSNIFFKKCNTVFDTFGGLSGCFCSINTRRGFN
jgi:hypothetical protein